MSAIIELKVSGEKDFGCITPEELIRFCIDYQVDRINEMGNIWIMQNIEDESITEETLFPFGNEEYPSDKWTATQTDRWEFDVN